MANIIYSDKQINKSLSQFTLIAFLAFLLISQNIFAAVKPQTKKATPKAPAKKATKVATSTKQTTNQPSIRKFIPFPKEVRGVWISFLDWEKMPYEKKAFEKEAAAMLDRCVELHLNTVFVHARSHSDAMYKSMYYPWSRFITGTQGKNPGYDPFKIFIDLAHKRGLSFHAWINPYRVTGHMNDWSLVAKSNPAKKWLNDKKKFNDRWVLKHKGEYYLNPSIPEVRKLIINGVNEVICNYNVDGIHFDDYFYPSLDDSNPKTSFDKKEYIASKSKMSIDNWRRNNVNILLKEIYKTVKKAKPSTYFGISPMGNLSNLRSNNNYFTDIDTWFKKPGYIDYIAPQLYWGFEAKTSAGQPAPHAFLNILNEWVKLKKNSKVKLFLGLALYRVGTDIQDNNKTSEWLRYNDIMKRQIEAGRATGSVTGYIFFNYKSFQNPVCKQEVENIISVFQNTKK